MKIKIQDFLDNSYILSIDKKRQYIIKKCFYDYGIKITHVYEGFSDRSIVRSFENERQDPKILNGAYNCSLGHTSIIKLAKCLQLPFVCIFEDDAYPMTGIKNKLQMYLNNIPDDADVISLGWSRIRGEKVQKNDFFQTIKGEIHGSHSYVIFSKAYDRYLEYYSKNTRTPSDLMMFSFPNAKFYKTNESLFIQYNKEQSNWGCVGYIYENNNKQIHSMEPPRFFTDIDPYLIQYEIENGIVKNILSKYNIKEYKDLTKFNRNFKSNGNVVLIGGSNSIKNGLFGKYIDSQDTVIRVNTSQMPNGYERYCGTKTDILIASAWHLEDNIIFDNILKNISWYMSKEDIRTMNFMNQKFTTGFIALMICLSLFKRVEIFGFGTTGDYNYHNGTVDSFHLKDKVQHNCCHNFNVEHRNIDFFIRNNYVNKLIRGEESHPELLTGK